MLGLTLRYSVGLGWKGREREGKERKVGRLSRLELGIGGGRDFLEGAWYGVAGGDIG